MRGDEFGNTAWVCRDTGAVLWHRGAYARFKDLLERHHSLDAWHPWETEQTRQALRMGCAANGVELAG